MADCPKCNSHLKMTDWKQHCPHCGANIVIYDLQERLMKEADIAEVQYYHFQKKIDCIKAAFAGSKLSVVRIFTSLIPIAALFLPVIKLTLEAPFSPHSGNTGLLEIINMTETFSFSALAELFSAAETKAAAVLFILGAVFLLLSIVLVLVHFICLIFTYFPKGKRLLFTLDAVWLVLAVLSGIMFFCIPSNDSISAVPSYGMFLFWGLLVLSGVMDFLVFKKNIEIKHAPCFVGGIPVEEYFEMQEKGVSPEEIRSEMYKRLTEIQQQQEAQLNSEEKKKEVTANG